MINLVFSWCKTRKNLEKSKKKTKLEQIKNKRRRRRDPEIA